jgi:hypothetical protein
VFAVIAKLSGMGYHEESANDARRRIVAFFAEHLKPLSRTNPAYSRPSSSSRVLGRAVRGWSTSMQAKK